MISLLYHDVVNGCEYQTSGFGGSDADIYKFSRNEFARHLDCIATAGVRITAPRDVKSVKGSNIVVLTFDDGGASAYSSIAPMLEEKGWRGLFFVSTDFAGKPGFLSPAQIADLDARGHVIGSHSCSHPPRISSCSPEQIGREWRDSVNCLAEITGSPIKTASVPGGFYSRDVAQAAAAAGIDLLFTSEPTAKEWSVNSCKVVGRYSVQRGVSAEQAAAMASGAFTPRMRQYVLWNAKKFLKKAGGSHYIRFRRAVLNNSGRP